LAPVHLPLPEAPHRGYGSAPELFTPPRPDDAAATQLQRLLRPHLAPADLVLAPQAIGGHVDHLLTARATATASPPSRIGWWRDVPYVTRTATPHAGARPGTPEAAGEVTVGIDAVLADKIAAAQCYTTQLRFQFGGPRQTATFLSCMARSEALRTGAPYTHAESLKAGHTALRLLESSTGTG
uniref:PIG-L deacetylase family protein n=1 Tax=Streptomyces alfalfae TaxID=1642299 RepID=UPI0028111508